MEGGETMANTNIKGIWLPIDILINSELNDKEKIIYTENDYEREIERINNKHEREVGKLNKYIESLKGIIEDFKVMVHQFVK